MDHPQTVSTGGDLTVIIATRNRAPILSGALLALSQQDLSPASFEVIVADNGSTDATPTICEAFAKVLPNLRLIRDPRPGQIVGWHCGLAASKGDILAFMDDDVRPQPTWAQGVLDAFADPAVGLATGPIVPLFEAPPPDWHRNMLLPYKGGGTWSALWGSIDLGPEPREISAGFVWGSNFLVRKKALLEARGFHPGGMPAHLFRFTGDGLAVGTITPRWNSTLSTTALSSAQAPAPHPASRCSLRQVSRPQHRETSVENDMKP